MATEEGVVRLGAALDRGEELELPIDFTTHYHADTDEDGEEWEDLFGKGILRQVLSDHGRVKFEISVSDETVADLMHGLLTGWEYADSTFRLFRMIAPASLSSYASSFEVRHDDSNAETLTLTLTLSDISVDEGRRQVFICGQPLSINAHRDFDVMQELVQAGGDIVSHGTWLRMMNPHTTSPYVDSASDTPSEVKSSIKRIRSALREYGCADLIRSVKSRGYCLDM